MRIDIATLLRLHRCAYSLLLHLDSLARDDPAWLSPAVVHALTKGRTAETWLREHRNALPEQVLPEPGYEGAFSELLASFLGTSFHVAHQAFDGELLFAGLRRGVGFGTGSRKSEIELIATAIQRVLARDGIRIDERVAKRLAMRDDIHVETCVVAYIWELERRACGKFRGTIVHRLWKSLPHEVRTSLSEEVAWLALDVVRDTVTGGGPEMASSLMENAD